MKHALLLLFVIGCGRVGFDAPDQTAASDAAGDPALPPDAGAPSVIRIVQTQAPGYRSAASVPITIDATAGDLLVAAVYWNKSANEVTMTDARGLGWMMLPAQDVPTGCGPTGRGTEVRLWYASIDATGSNTVSVAQTAGTDPLGMFLVELANVDRVDPVSASAGRIAPSTSTVMTAGPLTTNRSALILALFNDTLHQGTIASGIGYATLARDDKFYSMLEALAVAPGTYSPDASLPSGTMDACWAATAAAFAGR